MKELVLCFGEILWDSFGSEKLPGGAPMNVALHLLQQHIPAAVISSVGNDEAGHRLMAFLESEKLNTILVQTDSILPTCEVTVALDEMQQATYTIPKPVSWDNIMNNDALRQYVDKSKFLVFGSLDCRSETSRQTLLSLLENPVFKVFDVNLRAPHYTLQTVEVLASKADLVKMNEEEINLLVSSPRTLTEKILTFQQKFHNKTICVTRGENGAMVWHEGNFFEHSGFKVKVTDTVGAGDSFLATFIAGLFMQQQPIHAILERACAVGAFVASQHGANPKYNRDSIASIIKQGN